MKSVRLGVEGSLVRYSMKALCCVLKIVDWDVKHKHEHTKLDLGLKGHWLEPHQRHCIKALCN